MYDCQHSRGQIRFCGRSQADIRRRQSGIDYKDAGTAAVRGSTQHQIDANIPPWLRLHCHGQGTDLVERPLIRAEEPMVLAAGMNLACHPRYVLDGLCHWV